MFETTPKFRMDVDKNKTELRTITTFRFTKPVHMHLYFPGCQFHG